MSRMLYIRPVVGGDYVEGAVSSHMEALEEVFGRGFPMRLDEDSLPQLRAMRAATGSSVYDQIIESIEKFEVVELDIHS